MYQSIFKRYEKKYLLNNEQYQSFINYLSYNAVEDKYGKSTVCNIYYDTPDYRLIRASIEKPVYKEKLRLRCYGTPQNESNCFLEIKKKYKGVVYKRRINENYICGLEYLYGKKCNISESQIKNEIDYFLSFYKNLAPAMNIFYKRIAFYDRTNANIRFTFDSEILCRNYDFDLRNGIYGKKIIEDNFHLMEIKTEGAIPIWVSKILDELKIYNTSFSKYGTAYKQLILGENSNTFADHTDLNGGFRYA